LLAQNWSTAVSLVFDSLESDQNGTWVAALAPRSAANWALSTTLMVTTQAFVK